MRLKRALFIHSLFLLLAIPSARAEYRAYSLAVTNAETGQTRTLISTLDDIQYRDYYLLRRTETIRLADTWMCWGRQGDFKAICANPRPEKRAVGSRPTQPTARTPASLPQAPPPR